mgnify:CR=1 FL=1
MKCSGKEYPQQGQGRYCRQEHCLRKKKSGSTTGSTKSQGQGYRVPAEALTAKDTKNEGQKKNAKRKDTTGQRKKHNPKKNAATIVPLHGGKELGPREKDLCILNDLQANKKIEQRIEKGSVVAESRADVKRDHHIILPFANESQAVASCSNPQALHWPVP